MMYLNSTLALAVVGDQAVGHRRGIERILNLALVEHARKGMRVERVCSRVCTIVRDRASAGALPRRRRRDE